MICSSESCSAAAYSRGMCKSCYLKAYRRGGLAEAPYKPKFRSWTVAEVLAECKTEGACLLWTGSPAAKYPELNHNGVTMKVHRFVYQHHTGDTAVGRQIHHTCANSRCANPEHLQSASQADNVLEMLARRDYEARIAALEAKVAQLEAELDTHRAVTR